MSKLFEKTQNVAFSITPSTICPTPQLMRHTVDLLCSLLIPENIPLQKMHSVFSSEDGFVALNSSVRKEAPESWRIGLTSLLTSS
jgi:hypothetical protein